MKKIRIVIEGGGPEQSTVEGITIQRMATMTRVFIDGEEQSRVQAVKFEASAGEPVLVTVSFFPDEVEIETEVGDAK